MQRAVFYFIGVMVSGLDGLFECICFVLLFCFLLVAQAGAQSTVCYWQVVGSLRLFIGVYLIYFDICYVNNVQAFG